MTKYLPPSFAQQVTILRILFFLLLAIPSVGQIADSSAILRRHMLKGILKDDTLIVEDGYSRRAYGARAFIRHRYQAETAQIYIISKYFSDSSLMSNSKQIVASGGALYTASSLLSEDFVKKILADNVGFTPKYVEKYSKNVTNAVKSRLVKGIGAFFIGFGAIAYINSVSQEIQDVENKFPKRPTFGNEELLVMVLDLRQEPFVKNKVLLLDLIDHSLTSKINEDDFNTTVNRIDSILSKDLDLSKARIFQRDKWIASNIDTLPLPTLPKYVLNESSSSGTKTIPIFAFALIGGAAFVLVYFVLVRKDVLK